MNHPLVRWLDQLRIIRAKAAAWDAISEALTENASGHASAADVCAVGFDLQQSVALEVHRRDIEAGRPPRKTNR